MARPAKQVDENGNPIVQTKRIGDIVPMDTVPSFRERVETWENEDLTMTSFMVSTNRFGRVANIRCTVNRNGAVIDVQTFAPTILFQLSKLNLKRDLPLEFQFQQSSDDVWMMV